MGRYKRGIVLAHPHLLFAFFLFSFFIAVGAAAVLSSQQMVSARSYMRPIMWTKLFGMKNEHDYASMRGRQVSKQF